MNKISCYNGILYKKWLMLFTLIMSLSIMRSLMYMYTLLSDLMMIKVMNINSIFKRKHKYLVTFYKPSRVRKYICTRTIESTLQFALKKSFKYEVFTIKRLDR